MILDYVSAQDLFSYKKLDLSLRNLGLVLVEGQNLDDGGSNGAGKTSIFATIAWTLFGDSLSRKRSADGVIRLNFPSKEPVIGKTFGKVRFKVDSDVIEVTRYRQHDVFKNKIILDVNGVDKTGPKDEFTAKMICEMLQMDGDAFKSVVLFPQRATGFSAGTDSEQKALLERILNAQRFTKARARVGANENDLIRRVGAGEKSLARVLDSIRNTELEISRLREDLEEYDMRWMQEITRLRAYYRKLKLNQPTLDKELFRRRDELQRTLLAAEEQNRALAAAAEIKGSIKAELATIRMSQEALEHQTAGLQDTDGSPPPQTDMSYAYYEQTIREVERGIERANLEIDVYNSRIKDAEKKATRARAVQACPHCRQMLTDDGRKALFGSYDEDIANLTMARDALQQAKGANEQALSSTLKVATQALAFETWHNAVEMKKRLRDTIATKEAYEKQLVEVQQIQIVAKNFIEESEAAKNQFVTVCRMISDAQQLQADWKREFEKTEERIVSMIVEDAPQIGLLQAAQDRLAESKRTAKVLSRTTAELQKALREQAFWNRGFGPTGVKSLLIEEVIPLLNVQTAKYLRKLTGGNANVEFSAQSETKDGTIRDKISVHVEYLYGYNEYGGISGGESHRVDVATMFALGDLAASRIRQRISLRMMDEPFDDLDALGKERVFALLVDDIAPDIGTILVMSHDDHLTGFFEKKLRVVKEHGVSRIEHV